MWLRSHSCFLLETISVRSSQLRGAPSSSSRIKLSFSYPKSGFTSILVIWFSMCYSSAKRRAFDAILIFGFLTRNFSLPFGLVNSTVVSLGLNLMWLSSAFTFVCLRLYRSISGRKPEATVLLRLVWFLPSDSWTPAAFQAASFASYFYFAIFASALYLCLSSFSRLARIKWKLDYSRSYSALLLTTVAYLDSLGRFELTWLQSAFALFFVFGGEYFLNGLFVNWRLTGDRGDLQPSSIESD